MPLHPDYAALLKQLAEVPGPPLAELPTADARAMYRMMRPAAPELAVGNVVDRSIAGPAGDIRLRIYTPAGSGPFPLIVYFHGGGWVIGDLETADAVARQLCSGVGCVVVSVDYRLAPEHRYPAAVQDCYAATQWATTHLDELAVDAGRVAVAGESAGANLAAVVSLLARDRAGPAIHFQLLAYPVTDADFETASYHANADGYLLTRATMQWFWDQYCPDPAARVEPNAAPLKAADLAGLPPALIMTAEFDPLRDEGEAYAARLRDAGVAAESVRFDGLIHDFLAMSRQLGAARPGLEKAVAALRDAFGDR
jgi:acetyl esterase/lipase